MNVETRPLISEAEMMASCAEIQQVGIIGAGQMGNGIAHVCALAGLSVVMVDVNRDALTRALSTMSRNLDRQVSRSTVSADARDAALSRVSVTTEYESLHQADLVIEAATEKEDVKKSVYKVLTPQLKSSCILATNTSSISITRLGAATDRPGKFIGMHFMNPVPVMKLVEIIRGIATDESTFRSIEALARRLGKITAVSEDFPAFIVNRILVPMINEAVYALYEGVGSVTAIDTSMRLGANHPMGPLELADFIGLDTCLSIMQVLYDGLSDSKYRPCPLLVKYVEAGWVGRKSGRGFYDYSHTPPQPTR
jgi:3-hydroxybutyryl-CoA dehydrogenase